MNREGGYWETWAGTGRDLELILSGEGVWERRDTIVIRLYLFAFRWIWLFFLCVCTYPLLRVCWGVRVSVSR